MHLQFLTLIILSITLPTIYTSQQTHNPPYYSNKQASDCINQKAVPKCYQIIKSCTQDQSCANQLSKYQSCSFGKAQSEIFNGYCFRKWNKQSVLTKNMITCLVKECDLQYNSVVGLQELYDCTQETVINNYAECDQECLRQLNKIRDNFTTAKLDLLFQVEIENQSAQYIINLIKTTCIYGKPNSTTQQSQQTNIQQNINNMNNRQGQIKQENQEL